MSMGYFCNCQPRDRARWSVVQRECNHSKFNGRRRTPSAWSEVQCAGCGRRWRTKAAYVSSLPDRS